MRETTVVGIRSSETLLIVARLRQAAEVGEVVPYSDLSAIVGRDVQTDARGRMRSARWIILKEDGIWFAAVEGVGLRHCSAEEANSVAAGYRQRMRSAAKQGLTILAHGVRYEELTLEQQAQHNAHASLFGVIRHLTTTKAVAKIEARTQPDAGRLSIGETIEALRNIG